MPIGGCVITVDPEAREEALESFAGIENLEIHGSDDQGNIVAVIDSRTSREMQGVVDRLNGLECVLAVGMTYINVEDDPGSGIAMAGRQFFEEGGEKEGSE